MSYDLMEESIALACLSTDIAQQFFNSKLKVPLGYLVKAQIHQQEEMAVKIRQFYNKWSAEPISLENFDPKSEIWH